MPLPPVPHCKPCAALLLLTLHGHTAHLCAPHHTHLCLPGATIDCYRWRSHLLKTGPPHAGTAAFPCLAYLYTPARHCYPRFPTYRFTNTAGTPAHLGAWDCGHFTAVPIATLPRCMPAATLHVYRRTCLHHCCSLTSEHWDLPLPPRVFALTTAGFHRAYLPGRHNTIPSHAVPQQVGPDLLLLCRHSFL